MPILIALNELAQAMEAGGQPAVNGVRRRPDGQVLVDVWPRGLDAVANRGCRGTLWIEPGQEPTQGALYRAKAAGQGPAPSVSLVLGAGNQVSVAVCDILHKLFVEDAVVVCKMNPVNEALGPAVRRALGPLVDAGVVELVYGAAQVGRHLCEHPDVASIHLTGSAATYDAIVWQGQPKEGEPPCRKEVGAELGCVTPYFIVPGPWTASEVDYHAGTVAAALTQNAGHNCLKAELLVLDAAWELRDAFLAALRRRLGAAPRRVAWYPGSKDRQDAFRRKFGERVEELGAETGAPATPWLLATGLDPDTADAAHENWCGVLQEVALPGTNGDASLFLRKAAEFASERAWGSLSAGVIVHPTTRAQYPEDVDAFLAGLRYGAIAVNCPTMLNYLNTSLPWGAFPGNPPTDIGSGNCYVHNTRLFDHVQKGVVEAPFVIKPTPVWLGPPNAALAPLALDFFAAPSVWRLLKLVYRSIRG